jgi:hypothetical protein
MSFMIETSARHIHLTQETVEKLFGAGYQLTIRKPLSYPGQYACNERLTIVGPKKEMANVSILGPTRKADQVEVSATDARTLGIDAPIRESGDVKGSGACKLIGPAGEVELSEGVIVAKRHLHRGGCRRHGHQERRDHQGRLRRRRPQADLRRCSCPRQCGRCYHHAHRHRRVPGCQWPHRGRAGPLTSAKMTARKGGHFLRAFTVPSAAPRFH